jgi:hypothetical protein
MVCRAYTSGTNVYSLVCTEVRVSFDAAAASVSFIALLPDCVCSTVLVTSSRFTKSIESQTLHAECC